MRQHIQVTIDGNDYLLSQRSIKDIIDASNFAKDNNTPEASFFLNCFIIHSALKINLDRIPRYRFIRRRRIKKQISVTYLMQVLNVDGMIELIDKVTSLDYGSDSKKKIQAGGKQT